MLLGVGEVTRGVHSKCDANQPRPAPPSPRAGQACAYMGWDGVVVSSPLAIVTHVIRVDGFVLPGIPRDVGIYPRFGTQLLSCISPQNLANGTRNTSPKIAKTPVALCWCSPRDFLAWQTNTTTTSRHRPWLRPSDIPSHVPVCVWEVGGRHIPRGGNKLTNILASENTTQQTDR